jgi:hypothetical protein
VARTLTAVSGAVAVPGWVPETIAALPGALEARAQAR